MEKFEYKTLVIETGNPISPQIDDYDLQRKLDVLGKEGWELVSTAPVGGRSGGQTVSILSIFKRRIKE